MKYWTAQNESDCLTNTTQSDDVFVVIFEDYLLFKYYTTNKLISKKVFKSKFTNFDCVCSTNVVSNTIMGK